MKIDERVVPSRILVPGLRRLRLVHRVQRRMQTRRRHVFHVSAPRESTRRQLVRDRLHFTGEHASLSYGLTVRVQLDRGTRDEVLVNLTSALRHNIRSLPAYQGDVVVETV